MVACGRGDPDHHSTRPAEWDPVVCAWEDRAGRGWVEDLALASDGGIDGVRVVGGVVDDDIWVCHE